MVDPPQDECGGQQPTPDTERDIGTDGVRLRGVGFAAPYVLPTCASHGHQPKRSSRAKHARARRREAEDEDYAAPVPKG